MKAIFYDDPASDEGIWETELPAIPHIGDMVSLFPGDDYQKIGRVVSVEWCIYKTTGLSHVEIILELM